MKEVGQIAWEHGPCRQRREGCRLQGLVLLRLVGLQLELWGLWAVRELGEGPLPRAGPLA